MRTAEGARKVRAEQGSYVRCYELSAKAVRTGGPPPVGAAEAVATLAVLDAARPSAETGEVVAPVQAPPADGAGSGA